MQKKMIVLLAGAMLTMAGAGNAFAYFTGDDLIRVVYNATTGVETATDLGSITTILADAANTVVGSGADAFTTNGSPVSSFAGSSVAYFAVTGTAGLYVSGNPTVGAPKNVNTQWTATQNALSAIDGTYASLGGSTVKSSTNPANNNSYYILADQGGTNPGVLGGVIKSTYVTGTEASLATLTGATPLSQTLYYFSAANLSGKTAVAELVLQTNADGSTTINPGAVAATPIPPSFFLMGSGLLGMIGLRRKKA